MSQPLAVGTGGAFSAAVPVNVEAAREALVRVCGRFELVAHEGSDTFTGAIEMRDFGLFKAAVVATEVDSVCRDAAMIRHDPAKHLFLIYQESGESLICHGETETLLRPGSFHLVDSAFPSVFRYKGGLSRKVSVHLPRDETLRRLRGSCIGGLPIDPHDPLSTALEAVLVRMITADQAAVTKLADTLVELLATYVRCRELEVPAFDARASERLARARTLIEMNAGKTQYDLDALASDLSMSRRSVQRIFAAAGETVTEVFQDARLMRAKRELLAAPERNVAEIAFEAGFNDLSHFHRVFRTRFGHAPGTLRRNS
ncbi:helix-turn-helix domain-containing protein [Martelella limonii]|uniref:helix-turn-helix domain-containing protein n=1 Tax=Martelella limonii TaxID=1647649 RepID=UPI001580907A|nr:helix-turn-helix domain-containing protein [Martelella limonii]